MEYAIHPGTHLRTQVFGQWRRLVAEGGEEQALVLFDAQLLQAVCLGVEGLCHADERDRALLLAATERHPLQVALARVVPLVIDAGVRFRIPIFLATDHGAAMRAAIDPTSEPVGGARYHHRCIADKGTLEVIEGGNLAGQSHEAPVRPAIDAFLLPVVDLL